MPNRRQKRDISSSSDENYVDPRGNTTESTNADTLRGLKPKLLRSDPAYWGEVHEPQSAATVAQKRNAGEAIIMPMRNRSSAAVPFVDA